MEYTLKLGRNTAVNYDKSDDVIFPDFVKIRVHCPDYVVPQMRLIARNGEASVTRVIRNGQAVDITECAKTAGVIEVEIQAFVKGGVAKKWTVEPLTVVEPHPNFEAIPAIEEMREELKQTREAVKELYKKVKESETL